MRGVIRRSKVSASPAVILNGSTLSVGACVSNIQWTHPRARYFDTFHRLVIDKFGWYSVYGRLGYLGRANACPQKLRTTHMWRANINLFPVECYRATAEFNRVWQLVVSQLVNGEVKTTPVCSSCPMSSFLCFPPTVHRPPRLSSSPSLLHKFPAYPLCICVSPFLTLLCDS